MRTHGILVKWNDDRGFGFVSVASGSEEVFVHVSAFPRDGQRPQVGEMVSFEIQVGADGKRKAVRVLRPGSRPSSAARPRAPRGEPKAPRNGLLRNLAIAASLAAIAAFGYTHWIAPRMHESVPLAASPAEKIPPAAEQFRCDGRIHCSQMRSCAEARYFSANCPGARMDGNRDGEPCEQQLCN
jgi:cold shock CspA family protein